MLPSLLGRRADAPQLQREQKATVVAARTDTQALSAQVHARLAASVPRAPVVDVPALSAELTPFVLETVHKELGPLLKDLHDTVQEMFRAQNAELHSAVNARLGTALQMVEAVQAWAHRHGMGSAEAGHRPPNAGAH